MAGQGGKRPAAKALACLGLAWVCSRLGSEQLSGFMAPAVPRPSPPSVSRGSELASRGEGEEGRGRLVARRARSPMPTEPSEETGKRRNKAGFRVFFQGRQVALRMNKRKNTVVKYFMHVLPGDTVQVMKGKDKGKVTTVLKRWEYWNKVLCLGVNYNIKHVRPEREDEVGQRVQVEAPFHSSNVMLYDEEAGVASPVGYRFVKKKFNDAGDETYFMERYYKATGRKVVTKKPPKWVPVLERGDDDDDDAEE